MKAPPQSTFGPAGPFPHLWPESNLPSAEHITSPCPPVCVCSCSQKPEVSALQALWEVT